MAKCEQCQMRLTEIRCVLTFFSQKQTSHLLSLAYSQSEQLVIFTDDDFYNVKTGLYFTTLGNKELDI